MPDDIDPSVTRAVSDAAEAMCALNHFTPGELTISELYSIVGSLDRLMYTLPQTLSTIARHIERLADDPALDHDGSSGAGDGTQTAPERAIHAALCVDRALVDSSALTHAHSDLGTLKRSA